MIVSIGGVVLLPVDLQFLWHCLFSWYFTALNLNMWLKSYVIGTLKKI